MTTFGGEIILRDCTFKKAEVGGAGAEYAGIGNAGVAEYVVGGEGCIQKEVEKQELVEREVNEQEQGEMKFYEHEWEHQKPCVVCCVVFDLGSAEPL